MFCDGGLGFWKRMKGGMVDGYPPNLDLIDQNKIPQGLKVKYVS